MSVVRGILWAAVTANFGVEVAVSDLEIFKRKFYSERSKAREEGINDFDCLQLITPPPDCENKWWIVRYGQVQREEQGGASQEGAEAL